ncbi:hypothetical protein [Neogemmobacter tilapiae]|uniref:Uncharacterized protein n=1 Tax=Neogemmobacter tilapiae TaxID=875041 RepID=A0A918TPQ0_9RHOB|nr:hypothetical protein [Gemmobacter tilapiae]GHC57853.1 hypothetical protein GCM10007315_21720 [Gemmobacter tilapiae]
MEQAVKLIAVWVPFLVIFGGLFLFLRPLGKRNNRMLELCKEQTEAQKQMAASLARIADALEARKP